VLQSALEFTRKREGRPSKAGFFVSTHKPGNWQAPETLAAHKPSKLEGHTRSFDSSQG